MAGPSKLLELPPEPRLMIYRQVLLVPNGVRLFPVNEISEVLLPLLLACKRIYEEAIVIIHNETEFKIFDQDEYFHTYNLDNDPWAPKTPQIPAQKSEISPSPHLFSNIRNLTFAVNERTFFAGKSRHWEIELATRMVSLKRLTVSFYRVEIDGSARDFTSSEFGCSLPYCLEGLYEAGMENILNNVPKTCSVVRGPSKETFPRLSTENGTLIEEAAAVTVLPSSLNSQGGWRCCQNCLGCAGPRQSDSQIEHIQRWWRPGRHNPF
ncbi:hypothetical protein EV356DRAFT_516945 [Viridothelium virens]|uniref:Uncharacterized protein n=1 Tax=Viridothelium virens TaxID=1048519 RepID=A0A6A6H647_VIRVR|nr:hypothetical protein EV356DRAFT_516945 [Viridothelium virens]